MRIVAGWRRLFARPSVPGPAVFAPFENPAVILAVFLVLSVALMVWADAPLGVWMRAFPEALGPAAREITRLGEGVEVLVGAGALLILAAVLPAQLMRRRLVVGANAITAGAAYVFFSVAGGGLSALAAKYMIGRARPHLSGSEDPLDFMPFALHSDYAAFPSGHSATAGAMAMALALTFPRLRGAFICLGVLICVSRQLVGAHWTSDTLMGWAVGIGFAYWLAHVFARRNLLFVYDPDGCLRRRRGRRPFHALLRRAAGR